MMIAQHSASQAVSVEIRNLFWPATHIDGEIGNKYIVTQLFFSFFEVRVVYLLGRLANMVDGTVTPCKTIGATGSNCWANDYAENEAS